MDLHDANCLVWDWIAGERHCNNAKPCTCGLRSRHAGERAEAAAGYRPLRPLGMSEDDWLRTLGIDPVH